MNQKEQFESSFNVCPENDVCAETSDTKDHVYMNLDLEMELKNIAEMKDLNFESLDILLKQSDDLYLEICNIQASSAHLESTSTFSTESLSDKYPPECLKELNPSEFSFNDRYAKLGRATALQSRLLGQSKKALRYCRNNISTIRGEQEREVIRVSLLSKLKLEAIRKEIYRAVTDVNQGAVTIKNLMFNVVGHKETYFRLNRTFYMCIFACEDQVFGSQWTEATNINNYLAFLETISFETIDPNFEMTLSVYSLTVPRANKQIKSVVNMISKPKLQLDGQLILTAANFQQFGKYQMKITNSHSDLDGKFTMDFNGKLTIQEKLGNYVNYGIHVGTDDFSGRFWCILDKHGLKFIDQSSKQILFLCFQNIEGSVTKHFVRNSISWQSMDGIERVTHVLQFNNETIMKHWTTKLNSLLPLYRQYYS